MRTIVKTGVVLLINEYDPYSSDKIPAAELGDVGVGNNCFTIYGDMHVIGQCVVLYVPNDQVPWPKVHGTLSLVGKYFYRHAEPYSTIVLEGQRIAVERDALHEIDLETFVRAGGRVRV